MKRILLATFLLIDLTVAIAQVNITVPYEYGQSIVKVKITYPASIVKPDSVALQVSYGGEYEMVKNMAGKPTELTQGYEFGHSFDKDRKYRVTVYQKGKQPVVSNEVGIRYDPDFTYSETGLPSVTNLKASLVEKNGLTYIRLNWSPVNGAVAYRLYIYDRDQMIWEASIGDQGYFYTTLCDYLVYTQMERTYTFTVGAIEGPFDNNDGNKLVNKVTITVPKK